MEHGMIDLETFGTQEDSVIFQISVQAFDPLQVGRLGPSFNAFVDINSQPERKIYPDTLKWWLGQDRTLLNNLIFAESKRTLDDSLKEMRQFLKGNKIRHLWANSPSFDIMLIRHASRPYGKDTDLPIQFWKERDVRTIKSLVSITDDDIDNELRFLGMEADTKHDARDDVVRQILLVQLAYRQLGIKE